jgi:hypothetical protein
VARNQHTFPLGKKVTDKIRDSVALTRPGGALYEHRTMAIDCLCDSELLFVRRFSKQDIGPWDLANGCARLFIESRFLNRHVIATDYVHKRIAKVFAAFDAV